VKITLDHIYFLVGIALFIFTAYTVLDRSHKARWGTAAFWGIYGVTFVWGNAIPAAAVGALVVLMAVIASAKLMGTGAYNETSREEKTDGALRFGNWLFAPALSIPLVTFLIAKYTTLGALVGLGIGSIVGWLAALAMTRESPLRSCNEGRRLIDAIGWAIILSQFLAALGFLFDKAGVGKVVASLVSAVVPTGSVLGTVIAYCVGMALFTMIMGNGFAAFAVITTGIGIPLVIKMHGADPAIAGVIAMLAGYCGTLMTPMAANFNVVPAALLEMADKNGVIKTQVVIALPLLIINIALMYLLAFPGVR
jgi:Predicted membrane protein